MTGKGAAVAWSNAVSVDVHRGLVSCTRAPLNMLSTLRAFPSWQAYSYIGSAVRVNGTTAVQARVQTKRVSTLVHEGRTRRSQRPQNSQSELGSANSAYSASSSF